MSSNLVPFRDLVDFAIGGGWGTELAQSSDDAPVTIIRGTDFARLAGAGLSSCPRRYETAKRARRRILQPGDIVLEISGGNPRTGQTTGRSCFVTHELIGSSDRVVIPASLCRLVRVRKDKVVPRFAYYLLQDMWSSGRAGRYENQSTGLSNFQFEYFLDEERVWVPTLDEQQRIVDLLGGIDDKIDSNGRVVQRLLDTARGLFDGA